MSTVRAVVCGEIVPGVQTRNVFTYDRATGALTSAGKSAIATQLNLAWLSIAAYVSAIWVADRIEWYEWDGEEWQPRGSSAFTPSMTGQTDMMPSSVAALVSAFTDRKRVRGKKFIAGLLESAFTDGVPIAGLLASLAAFVARYIQPVSVSQENAYYPGCWTNLSHLFTPFVSGDASSYASTMRRRKPGVGI